MLLSHLFVVAVGTGVIAVITRWSVPRLFQGRYGNGVGRGRGAAEAASLHDALLDSLDRALVIAAVSSVVIAGATALLLARRVARPLEDMSETTRRIRSGDYAARVATDKTYELRTLADDINGLGASLASTEEHRRRLMTELAHELRTPIATISGFLEGLQDGVIEATPELFAELADEAARCSRLTEDLGLLSRIDEQRLELRLTRFDLDATSRRVAERLRPQFDSAGVTLTIDPPTGPLAVEADEDRVVQILTNLLANAMRYTPVGGHVSVTCGRLGQTVACTIADDGDGIAPHDLDQIFERFHRGSNRRGVSGSGVGLTVARSLARAHGGDITTVSPGLGSGAAFTLQLPATT